MQLIRELERTRDETLKCFSLDHRDLARTYAPGKWSVGYILHHLSDSETVFFDRIRRVLSEPRPVLWVMDQDAWAKGRTLRDEFDKTAVHNEHHLRQIGLALGRPAA